MTICDYMLCTIEIDTNSDVEVTSLINNLRTLSELYKLLGVLTNYVDMERTAFDQAKLVELLDAPERIKKLQAFRAGFHAKYHPDLVTKFEKYREEHFESTGGAK